MFDYAATRCRTLTLRIVADVNSLPGLIVVRFVERHKAQALRVEV